MTAIRSVRNAEGRLVKSSQRGLQLRSTPPKLSCALGLGQDALSSAVSVVLRGEIPLPSCRGQPILDA